MLKDVEREEENRGGSQNQRSRNIAALSYATQIEASVRLEGSQRRSEAVRGRRRKAEEVGGPEEVEGSRRKSKKGPRKSRRTSESQLRGH